MTPEPEQGEGRNETVRSCAFATWPSAEKSIRGCSRCPRRKRLQSGAVSVPPSGKLIRADESILGEAQEKGRQGLAPGTGRTVQRYHNPSRHSIRYFFLRCRESPSKSGNNENSLKPACSSASFTSETAPGSKSMAAIKPGEIASSGRGSYP